uniref:hypothetical protein n=1 Tax=Allisonella histaminiformans TaxID=209880 RepID=UPI0026ECB490
TDSKMAMPFLPTANNVCGPYPFSPERETFCKLSLCEAFEFLSLYKKNLSMEVFFLLIMSEGSSMNFPVDVLDSLSGFRV